MARKRSNPAPAPPPALGPARVALLGLAYFVALLALYSGALTGPFVSDDIHYVAANPYVHGLSWDNVIAILKPWGPATIAVVNYSPVQLLLHATVWQLFGAELFWHHALSLAFHAAASALFMPLLLRSGLPRDAYARARVNRSGRRYASVHVEAWQDNRARLFAQATGHFLMPSGGDG